MELLNIDQTAVTALFQVSRPEGALPPMQLINKIAERYQFESRPGAEELFGEKTVFMHGAFKKAAIDVLEMYRDGLIVRSRIDSQILDDFIADLNRWGEVEFGAKVIPTHRVSRNYESQILFKSESEHVLGALDALSGLAKSLSAKLQAGNEQRAPFSSFGFTLACDPLNVTGLQPAAFRVERRAGVAYEFGYYYSLAPLRTKDHIALIEELERGT